MAHIPHLFPNQKDFGDPFLLPSTASFPKDIKSTLDMCLYLYRMNRLYGAAINRIVTYFITDLEFGSDVGETTRQKVTKLLVEDLRIYEILQRCGIDWAIYGNTFVTCVEPFTRWLLDDRDGKTMALSISAYPEHLVKYDAVSMEYEVPDLVMYKKMKEKGPIPKIEDLPTVKLKFIDKLDPNSQRYSVLLLDPRYVNLDKAHFAQSQRVIYTPPPTMVARVKNGELHEVNNTPRIILQAISEDKDCLFRPGEVFHFKGITPTGVSDSGWAVPEILLHYDSLYQIQIYRKADFAIAQDYLTPFRWMSPGASVDANSPSDMLQMSEWRGELQKMIQAHRLDATSIHALPFPIQPQQFSGEGRQMVMHEVVEAHINIIFDGLGLPRELFKGTLTVEQLPAALRMFERSYEWLYQQLNGALKHITKVISKAADIPEFEVSLRRPEFAYNTERLQLMLQLVANREMPRAEVYRLLGIANPVEAHGRALQEEHDIARKSQEMALKYQKEEQQGSMAEMALMAAEQAAGAQGQAPGGAPPAAGGAPELKYDADPADDPMRIEQRAQEIAQTWLQMHAQQPNSHRSEMQKCEATNKTLYASAKQALEKLRAQGESQGRNSAGMQ